MNPCHAASTRGHLRLVEHHLRDEDEPPVAVRAPRQRRDARARRTSRRAADHDGSVRRGAGYLRRGRSPPPQQLMVTFVPSGASPPAGDWLRTISSPLHLVTVTLKPCARERRRRASAPADRRRRERDRLRPGRHVQPRSSCPSAPSRAVRDRCRSPCPRHSMSSGVGTTDTWKPAFCRMVCACTWSWPRTSGTSRRRLRGDGERHRRALVAPSRPRSGSSPAPCSAPGRRSPGRVRFT